MKALLSHHIQISVGPGNVEHCCMCGTVAYRIEDEPHVKECIPFMKRNNWWYHNCPICEVIEDLLNPRIVSYYNI